MPRFPISKESISNNTAVITGDDYKHIVKVLRLKKGDKIILFDSESTEYNGNIIELNSKKIVVNVQNSKQVHTESKININLFQSLPKSSKMDYIVQKTTELGVKSITPILTQRTNSNKDRNQRWQKIATEACKQSGRTIAPIVKPTICFNDLFSSYVDSDIKIILYENSKNSLRQYFKNASQPSADINIIIGPEGGFASKEVELSKKNNYKDIGLGPRILRTETASIALISIIQYEFDGF